MILDQFINQNKKVIVLTGAGISTESGLPDYRSAGVGLYDSKNHKPVQHLEFITSDARRKSYWCRNYFAWDRFKETKPNVAHVTLKKWQDLSKVDYIVTQNVDRLHQKAGSVNVIELHGSGFLIKCLSCDFRMSRLEFQEVLHSCNPSLKDLMIHNPQEVIRPDGDIMLSDDIISSFHVPKCLNCSNGILKPDITFFGDNVPKERVDIVYRHVENSDGLLVVGSSLQVYSGYRFVLHALDKSKSVAIISIGKTRADHLASSTKHNPRNSIIFIRKRAGEILPRINIVT